MTAQVDNNTSWALGDHGTRPIRKVLQMAGLASAIHPWTRRSLEILGQPRAANMRPGPWWELYCVIFSSISQARELLPLLSEEGKAKRLIIVVEQTWLDFGWPLQMHGQQSSFSLLRPEGAAGPHVIQLVSDSWLDIKSTLNNVLSGRRTSFPQLELEGRHVGIGHASVAAWAAGDPLARSVQAPLAELRLEPVDVLDALVTRDSIETGSIGAQAPLETQSVQLSAKGLPPVDLRVFSPRGFEPYGSEGSALLHYDADEAGWRLTFANDCGSAARSLRFRQLDENIVRAVRSLNYVEISSTPDERQWDLARVLSQLCVAGVPLLTNQLSETCGALLGADLEDALRAVPASLGSVADRESASIACRRAAIRKFSPARMWRAIARSAQAEQSVSVLLVTKRARYLPAILTQILKQSWSQLEVILVLHGIDELTPAESHAIHSFPRDLKVFTVDGHKSLGEALNVATSHASGSIIAKMDDDDWYGPHHIEDLMQARDHSGAALVGSQIEFAYLAGPDVTTRRPYAGERYFDHVAGGTMLMSLSDLTGLGGWRPVASAVDRGVIDSVLSAGQSVYRSHGQNYMMQRHDATLQVHNHTWDANEAVFVADSLEQWPGLHFPPAMKKEPAPGPGRAKSFRSRLSWS